MKLAFVHCWVSLGGALHVLEHLIHEELEKRSFDPEKDKFVIFTIYSELSHLVVDGIHIPIVTALPTRLNTLFFHYSQKKKHLLKWLLDYRNLMPFYPLLMKVLSHKVKHFWPKKIVISSFAVAKNLDFCHKGIKNRDDMPHIALYLHSPMQYIWSHYKDYTKKLKGIKGRIFSLVTPFLRKRDLGFTVFDEVYFNSEYTSTLAQRLYAIQGEIRYPQLNPLFYTAELSTKQSNYYVLVGRLVRFVRECDVIIKLFNELKLPLLVIGSGPDEGYLKQLAHDNITFAGQIHSVEERIELIQQSKGLINLTKESFGMGTAEALLLGVPVFGLDDGATPELVDQNSGVLVKERDIKHLVEAFAGFAKRKRDRHAIVKHIRTLLDNEHNEHNKQVIT